MKLIGFIKGLYFNERFFVALTLLSVCFVISFWAPFLYPIIQLALLIFFLLIVVDGILLFRESTPLEASRKLPEKFSNGDDNTVEIELQSKYTFPITLEIIDEIPQQFQKRDFHKSISIGAQGAASFKYSLRPMERGEYSFGFLNIYIKSKLGLLKRRIKTATAGTVKVYPSIIQMKKYAFLALDNRLSQYGMKKMRRIGHTLEFEQIKDYVSGDDARTINWKATAKRGGLMVNQYQDEKSQPVYSIIDASRVMKMPFDGLTLLDYAINSTLAFSNIALSKKDKVGMLTFAETIKNQLPASSKKTHLESILDALYLIDTQFYDADFSLLYARLKRSFTQRSLLLLYTNFEHPSALERQLPYLRAISKKHVLVIIFFINTELTALIETSTSDLPSIYHKTLAQKADYEKRVMSKTLEKYGIQTILTTPQNLTVSTINKYLEIKAKGIL